MSDEFVIGDRVRLKASPPYFKTAEPMPMLRPSDLVSVGTVGIVQEQRPGGYWAVKFEQGALLVDRAYLERAIADSAPSDPSAEASER